MVQRDVDRRKVNRCRGCGKFAKKEELTKAGFHSYLCAAYFQKRVAESIRQRKGIYWERWKQGLAEAIGEKEG